nr:YfiM family protein [Flavobacterium sp. N502540]
MSVFSVNAQSRVESFLTPSDTLNKKRQNTVIITEATLASVTLLGLNQLWYADYPRSNFHFINDNNEWLQMDKVGHMYSAYHLGRFGAEMMKWSGADQKKQLIYGAGFGFAFLTAVEVLDGFSSEWGASSGDVIANATGTALYVSQELLWKEQRIVPKFSFHTTQYANLRPKVLGSSLNEQLLKDYNGQTYWLSVNLHSFAKESKIPKWLNVAFGYGADGMLTGNLQNDNPDFTQNPKRFRQIYLSFDVNLAKIETKSHFLKTIFSIFNTIKIPAPTLEYSANKGLKAHAFYF